MPHQQSPTSKSIAKNREHLDAVHRNRAMFNKAVAQTLVRLQQSEELLKRIDAALARFNRVR
jgi:hypothetical protein